MTKRFAQIIIDISHEKVDRTFDYRIPPQLEDRIFVGVLVKIPFGKGNSRGRAMWSASRTTRIMMRIR